MSWEGDLIYLYDQNASKIGIIEYKQFQKNGKEEKIPYVLLPLFHTTVTAQIQVTLSSDGKFLRASKVAASDKFTIIPVTEKSRKPNCGESAASSLR